MIDKKNIKPIVLGTCAVLACTLGGLFIAQNNKLHADASPKEEVIAEEPEITEVPTESEEPATEAESEVAAVSETESVPESAVETEDAQHGTRIIVAFSISSDSSVDCMTELSMVKELNGTYQFKPMIIVNPEMNVYTRQDLIDWIYDEAYTLAMEADHVDEELFAEAATFWEKMENSHYDSMIENSGVFILTGDSYSDDNAAAVMEHGYTQVLSPDHSVYKLTNDGAMAEQVKTAISEAEEDTFMVFELNEQDYDLDAIKMYLDLIQEESAAKTLQFGW